MGHLVVNRWKTPDGTILQSKYGHDFVSHVDKNGETYFIDGGIDYIRMSSNIEPMEDLCLSEDDSFEEIRKYFCRGTFDEDGNRIWKPIQDMSDEHLKNCIIYNIKQGFSENCISNKMYQAELNYRKEKNISITD